MRTGNRPAFLLVLGFLLCLPAAVLGQSSPNQINPGNATGVQPYNVYGGVRENINLSNGNLNLQIPLLSLPGRNGHDVVIGLEYDSKIWSLHHELDEGTGFNHYWWDFEARVPALRTGAFGGTLGDGMGWRLNIPVLQSTFRKITPISNISCHMDFIATLSDGSKHWFQNKAKCGKQVNGQWQSVTSSPTVSDSEDGAFLRLDTTDETKVELHLKDGTIIRFLTSLAFASNYTKIADKIIDTDGNLITISSTTCALSDTCRVTSITDTVNRVITFNWVDTQPPPLVKGYLDNISFKDSGGTDRTITFQYADVSITATFTEPTAGEGGSNPASFIAKLLDTVKLPNGLPQGLTYAFQYNNFGELTKITYPTRGYTRYAFQASTHWWEMWASTAEPTDADFRELRNRYVCREASGVCGAEDTTIYTPTVDGTKTNNQYMEVTDPDSNGTKHQFAFNTNLESSRYFSPRELRREIYQGATTLMRTIQTDYNQLDANGKPQNRSLPIRVTTTLNDISPALVSKVEWDYDTYTALVCPSGWYCAEPTTRPIDNVTEQREHDYGTNTPGVLVRKTVNTWLKTNPVNNQNYHSTAIYILDRKATEKVYTGAGVLVAQTDFEYDNYTSPAYPLLDVSPAPVQRANGYGLSYTTRGNLTLVKRWRDTPAPATWLETRHQYDIAGNLRKTKDPNLHETTFNYTDSWGNTACTPVGGPGFAYLTSVTNHLNQTSSSTYNSCTGTVASTTDVNGQVTQFTIYDVMGRLRQTVLPATQAGQGQIDRAYNETSAPLSVTTTTKLNATTNLVSTVWVDGLGRVYKTVLNSDPQGAVYTRTEYDKLGRKWKVWNPTRCDLEIPPSSCSGETTFGLTEFVYDALSRVCVVVPPDGTAVPGGVCPTPPPANDVFTEYSGSTTTVTDQAGKKRKSETDALGRLIRVWEPDASQALVHVTRYQYDVLDNLRCVHQKSTDPTADKTCDDATVSATWRARKFTYNSLSQLTQAVNPESGTISYTYDDDGNLSSKLDARSITTTYAYDALHRLTQKSYSDGTATVRYGYDGVAPSGCTPPTLTFTNAVGRRTQMCDVGGGEAWSYDALGRVLIDRRATNSVTKEFRYTYDLNGSVTSLQYDYPSGPQIDYTYNAAGRAVSATGGATNYATGVLYAPQGALATLQNGASLVSTYFYNNRLQPCRISVKSSGAAPTSCGPGNTGNVLDFTYGFDSEAAAGVQNNGNVGSITNNRDSTRTQSFTYDELNRIKTGGTAATWGLSFAYDVWANLLDQTVSYGGGPPNGPTELHVTVGTSNRIATGGFTYDAAGNLINYSGQGYTYDAENRLLTAAGVTYTYDGDGRRVKKSNGILYWYGAGSEVLLETSLTGTRLDAYIFFNGSRVARRRESDGAVFYFFADHLGSSRTVTNSTGGVVEDSDFYPFGGERIVVDALDNNYKFTNKERDAESGLDFFLARHYSSNLGRFLQPDEFAGGPVDVFSSNDPLPPGPLPYADIVNPQSLNKYTYTYNNPLRYVDPGGHAGVDIANSIDAAVDNAVASVTSSAVGTGDSTVGAATTFVAGAVGDLIKGGADVLRLGEGTANAIDAAKQGDYSGAAVEASKDAGRVGAVILTVVVVASAAKGTAPAAEPASGVQANRAAGLEFEGQALKNEGLAKNTTSVQAVDPKTGKTGTTVPDAIRPNGQTVDAKAGSRVSDSAQLRRQSQASQQTGQKAQLIVKKGAKVSKTVQGRMDVKEQ